MNILRKAEESRILLKEALNDTHSCNESIKEIILRHTYNISVLLRKIDIWMNNGAKTFLLSNDLIEAFQHTDIPMDSYPTDFQYPFDAFMIESEQPMFTTNTFASQRNIYAILYLSDSVIYKDPKALFIDSNGTITTKLKWNKSLTAFYPSGIGGLENMMIHMSDSAPIIDAIEQIKEGFGIFPLSKEDARNLINIFYNTVMYINDPERNKNETEIPCSRKIKLSNDSKHSRATQNYILLKPPRSYIPFSGKNKGYTLDKRFIVRGHWRMQPYGEKHSLRKRIWIKPYYKGPELAEIINKPYKVN